MANYVDSVKNDQCMGSGGPKLTISAILCQSNQMNFIDMSPTLTLIFSEITKWEMKFNIFCM